MRRHALAQVAQHRQQVNGRFHVADGTALAAFSRFFLPQRMSKNGYDRRKLLAMLRYLGQRVAAHWRRGNTASR